MGLKKQIEADLKQAMKSRDLARRDVLRMVRAGILDAEVERRSEKGHDYQLSDAETLDVLTRYAKQRRQSIDAYREGDREDLAAKEEEELAILQDYLPKQMSREAIAEIVREAMAETGASTVKDLGAVMRVVMPKVKGAADGKTVNEVVRDLLK